MDDTISRMAAINVLDRLEYTPGEWATNGLTMCKDAIKALPSAQPGWIPVTERLPTENKSYLVWMPFTPEGHHITVAEWCSSYWNIKTPIMAWMPMPTPYREGGQDSTDHFLGEIRPGHWMDKGSLSCRCSECGCKSPKEYPYCPNCGIRMEK